MWRVPFLIGGTFGVFSVFLRQWLHETPVFLEMQRKKISENIPIKSVLSEYKNSIKIVVLLTLVLSTFVVVILMTLTLLQTYFHLSVGDILLVTNFANVSLVGESLFFGYLADRIGVDKTITIGMLGVGGAYFLLFYLAEIGLFWMGIFYTLTGLFVGVVAAIPFVFIHLFPPEVRFTGISFSYNLSYAIFAGLIPFLISPLAVFHKLGAAFFVITICVVGLFCSLVLIQETAR